MRHIHDVGHHLKNAQASLERGIHFDGHFTHESKDYGQLPVHSTNNNIVFYFNVFHNAQFHSLTIIAKSLHCRE